MWVLNLISYFLPFLISTFIFKAFIVSFDTPVIFIKWLKSSVSNRLMICLAVNCLFNGVYFTLHQLTLHSVDLNCLQKDDKQWHSLGQEWPSQ